jgi:hypothetical protein
MLANPGGGAVIVQMSPSRRQEKSVSTKPTASGKRQGNVIELDAGGKGFRLHHGPAQGEGTGVRSGRFNDRRMCVAQDRTSVRRPPRADELHLAEARDVEDCRIATPVRCVCVRKAFGTAPQGDYLSHSAEHARIAQRRQGRAARPSRPKQRRIVRQMPRDQSCGADGARRLP